MNNIFVFIGPCKTGTTSLYQYFKGRSDVCVLGGKEFYDYKNKNGRKKISKIAKSKDIPIIFFDHDALFSESDMQALQELGCTPIIVVRDPFDQTVSRIMHDIRVGLYDLTEVLNCDHLDEIDKRLYGRSDYLKWHTKLPNIIKKRVVYIDFKLFKSNLMVKKLEGLMNLEFEHNNQLISKTNQARLSRFSGLILISRLTIRPVFYFLGLSAIWSKLKLSKLAQILYSNKRLEETKKAIQGKVDRDYTNKMFNDFKQEYGPFN